jgi:hypothetical protein
MSYETGAPPPPDHPVPAKVTVIEDAPGVPAARPARGFDATAVIPGLGGPPPGTVTYRLRGTETTETTETADTGD